jgi:hypothetical protein
MMSKNLKIRPARLEAASQPKAIGVIYAEKGEELVTVDGVKMSEEEFCSLYPGGMIIRVVREDKKPNIADV